LTSRNNRILIALKQISMDYFFLIICVMSGK